MQVKQIIGNKIDDKNRKPVDKVVMTAKNRMQDAILTSMDTVVMLRVEMAVRSITRSSGHGPSTVVQNPDRRDFTENNKKTPLISASS